MTWKAFHNRGETLRSVIATAEVRRDGILPMDVAGVAETFADELDLLSALQLKWYTRLSGHIERIQANQPLALQDSVAIAWSNAAHELGGVRLILDHYLEHPIDERMAEAVATAAAKEHYLLAVMAGRTSLLEDATAHRIGAEIEQRARELHRDTPVITPESLEEEEPEPRGSLLSRLRAVVAA